MSIRHILLSFLLIAAAMPAGAHMHQHEGDRAALGASAAFAPDGRLWVVSVRDRHVLLRHSDDRGRTLSAPVTVNAQPEPISASGENRPRIALGPHGEIYVSWTRPLSKPYTGYIRFARSLDGGRHFDAPITVHHDRAVITHRFDTLAVDAQGNVLVAWIDKRDLEAARTRGKPYAGAAVYYAWSGDRGASFAPERKLADHSCECCRIAAARDAGGGIALFWRAVFGDNIRDHALAVLRPGAVAVAPARVTFTRWHITGCPHQGPGLVVDADGTRHGVWFSAARDQPTVWYGQLVPGHAPRHLLAVAGPGASHADVMASGRDVWIVWNQFEADGLALMLRASHDGGAHFGPARAIADVDGAAGSPQLLLWKGDAYAAWNTADGFRLVAVVPAR